MSSCNAFAKSETGYSLYFENDKKWITNKIEIITDDIQAKNNEHIKSLFSPNAAADSPELDADIIAMFELLSEEMVDYEIIESYRTSKKSDHGKIIQALVYRFYIYTSDEKYYFTVKECVFDNVDINKVGVTTIKITNVTLEDVGVFKGISDDDPPGIIIQDCDGVVIS